MRVLLLDDEPLVAMGLCGILEEMGHEAIDVIVPEDALALLASDPEIALVVADLHLMGEDRADRFLPCLRAVRPGLAVIVTAGYRISGVGIQADTRTVILSKVITPEALRRAIEAVVSPGC